MRILIVGGTRLVGRQIAAAAIANGHDVTLYNRGVSDPTAFPEAGHLTGDRNGDLAELREPSTGSWDATIDVNAYVPRQVRSLLEALGDRRGHYTFISTISVYGEDIDTLDFTERQKVLEPAWDDELTIEKYGELKVACEQVARELAGDQLLVIRPGYVIGPHDHTERFNHWVKAVAAGKPFVAPDPGQPLQCIDGRDLGAFTVDRVAQRVTDVYNVTAPQVVPTFAEVLNTIAAALDVKLPDVTWSAEANDDLPLSAPREWWPSMHADLSHATKAGLRWRPLDNTVRDIAVELGL
ncbi:MAG TPA: NAD-dependent epimerase/dehydratase family protein [Mycobacteriales bacterium]|nr:NAD-dependent epimerase/dehydratase family protein [Mycobacteriales bacterium]